MFKFNVGDKPVIAVSQGELAQIARNALKRGRYCAMEWRRADSGQNDRIIAAPIPKAVKAGFQGKRETPSHCIPFFSTDRNGVRTLREDSLRVVMANGAVYVATN